MVGCDRVDGGGCFVGLINKEKCFCFLFLDFKRERKRKRMSVVTLNERMHE